MAGGGEDYMYVHEAAKEWDRKHAPPRTDGDARYKKPDGVHWAVDQRTGWVVPINRPCSHCGKVGKDVYYMCSQCAENWYDARFAHAHSLLGNTWMALNSVVFPGSGGRQW